MITVPALRQLWSDWDVALHHGHRYHRRDLLELVTRPGDPAPQEPSRVII